MPTPSLRAPFMTPARGWLFLVVLSVALIGQTAICAMRASRLLRELNVCVRKLPPQPHTEHYPHMGVTPAPCEVAQPLLAVKPAQPERLRYREPTT